MHIIERVYSVLLLNLIITCASTSGAAHASQGNSKTEDQKKMQKMKIFLLL